MANLRGIVFALGRAYLSKGFQRFDKHPLSETRALKSNCMLKLRPSFKKLLANPEPICDRYLAYSVKYMLPNPCPSRYGLSTNRPIYLEKRVYGFGLISYRIIANILRRKDQTLEDLIDGWRGLANEFKATLERIMREDGVERFSHTSHMFSEAYALISLEGEEISPYDPRIVELIGLEERDIKVILSPLKVRVEPPDVSSRRIGYPVFVSRDGIMVLFAVEGQNGGYVGKQLSSRSQHNIRRRLRRLVRLAIDLALGGKVFLENPEFWLENDDCWGAYTGMIFLNPGVIERLGWFTNGRLGKSYKLISNSLNLEKEFSKYQRDFWFPFKSTEDISIILEAVRGLGGIQPEISQLIVPLDSFMIDVLKALILKEEADLIVTPERENVERIVNLLCDQFATWSEEGQVYTKEGCKRELAKRIIARGRRRGLTRPELIVLLSLKYHNAESRIKGGVMEHLKREGLVEESFTRRRGPGKAREVAYYIPVKSNVIIGKLEAMMREEIRRLRRLLE